MFFSCRPRQPPRLPRPQCMYAGCSHRALRCDSKTEGKAILSLYCKDHACRQRLGELMCPNYKVSGLSKYCEDHRRCENHGCPHQRICGDTSQDWPYCQKLFPRLSDTCLTQGCRQKRAAGSQMCTHHTPLCLIPGCGHPRTDDGLYCAGHSCADRHCGGVINGGHWCKDHRLCRTEGCGQPRAVTAGGGFENVCWQHLPAACLAPGCPGIVKGGVRFCPQHECIYPPCREQKDNDADPSRLYCMSHTCSSQACPQPAADLAGPSAARYCVTHKCAGAGCGHPAKPSGHHCALHACLRESCTSPRAADPLAVPGSQFCASHECRAVGCRSAARRDGIYCEGAHACAVPGCPAPRGGSSSSSSGSDVDKTATAAAWTASVCCASHTAMIARDSAAAWGFRAGPGEGRGAAAPQPPPSPATQRFPYHSQTEEALGHRLKEERDRLEREARLESETRAWHAAEGREGGVRGVEAAAVVGLGTRGRGFRRGRSGSGDSGFGGSPDVSDSSSSNTFVS
ncbi:hypothetical protein CGRA01v4_00436 [Colletotrichum graminicola]|uniref:Uncharacterized protein n=1 Tax=Colletotrichum graminicola (strain M1.001 / M2 / FGSC 10212) TaxID=645133 RepID=E3QH17_COLGM|nr:uncharacterized protein GLRG_05323 [Colletotrichum graminicola M1.001]EFQ30179.1 hypothetical protein GLRG_05323 [Colletotrichum graminicola M1.001]WDK09158.1 hypothetical protein CGRA01v4_00436 [Colletotrichum graminicola]